MNNGGPGNPEHLVEVVVLVASAGGLEALSVVLRDLPADLPAAVVVQQHLGAGSSAMADVLKRRIGREVTLAVDGARLVPGQVVLCPPLMRMEILPDGTSALLPSSGARERPHDGLLTSLADGYGPRALAVVLTGMLNDGAAGTAAMKAAGGIVFAQSEETAEQPSMPKAAAEAGADLVLPLREIGGVITDVVRGEPVPRPVREIEAVEATFGGRGRAAELAGEIDWSGHPLGPVQRWPPTMRQIIRLAMDSVSPTFVLWGEEYLIFFNDGAIPAFGNRHHEAFARSYPQMYPERWGQIREVLAEVMNGTPVSLQATHYPYERSGRSEDAWYEVAYTPIRDTRGGVAGVYGVSFDRTQEVLAARRLRTLNRLAAATVARSRRAAAERALAVLAEADDILFALAYILDPAAARAMLAGAVGVEAGSAIAPHDLRLIPGNAWPVHQVIEQGKQLLLDLDVRFRGHQVGAGALTPRHAVLHPLRDEAEDRVGGVLVLGLNPRLPLDDQYREFLTVAGETVAAKVAESQARQRERQRLERLAELDRAKMTFFANISHEFRAPLTSMLGPVRDMLGQQGDPLPVRRADVELVERDAERLLRLVGTLLDFSQAESGRSRAGFVPTDLAQLTAEIAALFQGAAEAAGLKLTVDAPRLPEPVWVDPEMWEKIVANLLSNALKFTWEGSVDVVLRALPQHAELVVRDTGIGIPADDIAFVLKRFHRVWETRGRTHDGTGVGLALVEQLTRLHHGRIRVTSKEGVGTTFTMWVPLGRHPGVRSRTSEVPTPGAIAGPMAQEAARWDHGREETRPTDRAVPRQRVPGACIVVVEDDADLRDHLVRLLGEHWEVVTARDGEQALRFARDDPPDLIVADVALPVVDGFTLLHMIRIDETLSRIPVVLVTAPAGEETAIEGLLAGADDYIVEPFSARELVARVGAQLELSSIRRRTTQRQTFLLTISDALRPLEDPAEIRTTAARLLGEHLGAVRVRYEEGMPTGGAAGHTLTVADVATDPRLSPREKTVYGGLGMAALCCVPLVKGGRVVAGLTVHDSGPRHWTDEEISLIEEVAERTWSAIERARAEQQLHEANRQLEEQFRTLVDGVGQTVWATDAEGRVVDDSPSWRAFTGQTVDERLSWGWVDAVHPEDRAYAARQWADAVDAGTRIDTRFRLHHAPSDSYHLTRVRAIPLRYPDGTIHSWLGMNTDLDD